MPKFVTSVLVGLALVVGVIIGHSFWPTTVENVAAISAVGTTNSTPRMAQIVANAGDNTSYVSGAVGAGIYTVASIANGDANDRIITSIDYYYQGLTTVSTSTAALTLLSATSSNTTTLNSNTNYVLNTTVATSTSVLFIGSTTPGQTGTNANRIWQAGSNLNFTSSATTSASLIIKVNYIAS